MELRVYLLVAFLLATNVVAQPISCGGVNDLSSFCTNECGNNTVKDVECDPTGPSCYCLNANGQIENTNVDADSTCGGKDLVKTCADQCNGEGYIDDFACQANKPKCTCAKDVSLPTQADLDYANAMDQQADEEAADGLVTPPRPSLPLSPPPIPAEAMAPISDTAANATADMSGPSPAEISPSTSSAPTPSYPPPSPSAGLVSSGTSALLLAVLTTLMA